MIVLTALNSLPQMIMMVATENCRVLRDFGSLSCWKAHHGQLDGARRSASCSAEREYGVSKCQFIFQSLCHGVNDTPGITSGVVDLYASIEASQPTYVGPSSLRRPYMYRLLTTSGIPPNGALTRTAGPRQLPHAGKCFISSPLIHHLLWPASTISLVATRPVLSLHVRHRI